MEHRDSWLFLLGETGAPVAKLIPDSLESHEQIDDTDLGTSTVMN